MLSALPSACESGFLKTAATLPEAFFFFLFLLSPLYFLSLFLFFSLGGHSFFIIFC